MYMINNRVLPDFNKIKYRINICLTLKNLKLK